MDKKVSDDNGYEEDAFEDSSGSPNETDADVNPANQGNPAAEATDVPAAETVEAKAPAEPDASITPAQTVNPIEDDQAAQVEAQS